MPLRSLFAGVFASALTLVCATVFTLPAGAVTATYDVSFSASNFSNAFGTDPPPVSTVTGSFSVTFDPLNPPSTDTSAGLVLNSLNLAFTGPFVWQTNVLGDSVFGGNGNSAAVVTNTNDFSIAFSNFPSAPTFIGFGYAQAGMPNSWRSNTVTFSVNQETPLPGSLSLFAAGLGAFGLLGWRRKKKTALTA